MARINFEDDVEAQDEFWSLLPLLGGDRDKALGKLLRFFRLAQGAWGHDCPMLESDLREKGFGDMIESGWAVPDAAGYHALGAKKHFAWYRQKVEAGKKGGRPPVSDDNRDTTPDNRSVPPANPLALALALAPAPALIKIQEPAIIFPEPKPESPGIPLETTDAFQRFLAIDRCKSAWLDTLAWAGQRRGLLRPEEEAIARAIRQHGAETVEMALTGARHEPAYDGWDPKTHVDIARVLLPDKENRPRIQKFVGWGAQAAAKEERIRARDLAVKRGRESLATDEPCAIADDPERVREILAQAGFGRPGGAA